MHVFNNALLTLNVIKTFFIFPKGRTVHPTFKKQTVRRKKHTELFLYLIWI